MNKIKNVIGSVKYLMQNDENAFKVHSLLETLKLLRDDATLLHDSVIPLLPVEGSKINGMAQFYGSTKVSLKMWRNGCLIWISLRKQYLLQP